MFYPLCKSLGLPWWLSGKDSPCNVGDTGDMGQEYPLEEEMTTHSSILAWRIDRGASWVTVHEGAKSWTQLSDQHFHFH